MILKNRFDAMRDKGLLLSLLVVVSLGLTNCRMPPEPPLTQKPASSPPASASGPSPQSSHNPFNTQQLETFEILDYRTVASVQPRACEPLSADLMASRKRLKNPVDIAVSPDGQSVYVINQRCEALDLPASNRYSQLCREGRDSYEERRFIYRIQAGQIELLTEPSGVPPLSCVLGNELEIDAQGHLLVTDVQQHRIYRLSPKGELEHLIQDKVISEKIREAPADSRVDKVKGDPRELEGPHRLFLNGKFLFWALSAKTRTFNPGAGSWQMKKYDLETRRLNSLGEEARSLQTSPAFKLRLYREVLPEHPLLSSQLDESQLAQQLETGSAAAGSPGNSELSISRFKLNAKGELFATSGHAVYRIVPFQGSTLWAGAKEPGFKDGQADEARFNTLAPELTLDAQGNLYVIDQGNRAIRKITPAGIVSTIFQQL